MSIKQKVLDTISAHPKLIAFAIGSIFTIAVGTAIGMLEVPAAAAIAGHSTQEVH
jgi:hypothetical protein